VARRKGEQAAEELREAYAKLIAIAKASRAQAARVRAALQAQGEAVARRLVEHFDQALPLMEQAIDQAARRVLEGEAVPAEEKLLSLFEPHTQVIRRHKAGQPTEFGRKLLLDEVEGGIVSRYAVLDEVGLEHPHLDELLAAVRALLAGAQSPAAPPPD
jgi:IS5 family transposase